MSELRIKQIRESCEVTFKAVTNKAQKKFVILFVYGYKMNSHLTCSRGGFIAQSVEHHTGIAEVMGSNPVEASDFFSGLSL